MGSQLEEVSSGGGARHARGLHSHLMRMYLLLTLFVARMRFEVQWWSCMVVLVRR